MGVRVGGRDPEGGPGGFSRWGFGSSLDGVLTGGRDPTSAHQLQVRSPSSDTSCRQGVPT